MVPPRLARKMSVLSVEPLALGGSGEIGAERAQRPGSRRLGGVEATGASVATADSWPDRRKGWASPEWGPALPLAVMGGIDTDPGVLTSLRVLNRSWCGSSSAVSRRPLLRALIQPARSRGGYFFFSLNLEEDMRSTKGKWRLPPPTGGDSLRAHHQPPAIPPDAPRRPVARTAPTAEFGMTQAFFGGQMDGTSRSAMG